MRSIKALQLLKEGRIAELKAQLEDEVYQESLKTRPSAKKRYTAMKKYFTYKDGVREICMHPAEVEFEGKKYHSFTNSYSLALTTEPIGEIDLLDESYKYPDISRLITMGSETDKINFERVIAEAKSHGYKLKKSELEQNNYLMHYRDNYFRIALVDCTYGIIADGEEATVYYNGKHRPVTVKNDIGICILLPVRIEADPKAWSETYVVEAIPKEGNSMTPRDILDIAELISRRRRQILVHSIIYYKFDDSLISDATWMKWANELADLQERYPEIAKDCPLYGAFVSFDPSTGYDLPLDDPWGNNKALQLLRWRDQKEKGGIT